MRVSRGSRMLKSKSGTPHRQRSPIVFETGAGLRRLIRSVWSEMFIARHFPKSFQFARSDTRCRYERIHFEGALVL